MSPGARDEIPALSCHSLGDLEEATGPLQGSVSFPVKTHGGA